MKNRSVMRQVLSAAIFSVPIIAGAQTEPSVGEKTVVVPGKNPKFSNHHGTFIVDTNGVGNWALFRADRLSILFNGVSTPSRQCPFIDLSTRDYKAIEIEKNVFRIDTKATAAEANRVEAAGCIVTTIPSISKIQYLPPPSPFGS